MRRLDEKGLTLTEVTLVGVIAVLVVLALTSFYFNSQRTWIESSTKAVAQREGTLIAEHLAQHVRAAGSYGVTEGPDSLHQTLTLWLAGSTEQYKQFTWYAGDGMVHELDGPLLDDRGPISSARVERFQLTPIHPGLLELTALELSSVNGERVRLSSRFALYNR